jgi:hypothetical protein
MSYRANLDIVIALNNLQITSFRKQGHLRFKLTLLQRNNHTPPTHKKKVHKYQTQIPEYNDSACSPYNIYKQPNNTVIINRDLQSLHPLGGNNTNVHNIQL